MVSLLGPKEECEYIEKGKLKVKKTLQSSNSVEILRVDGSTIPVYFIHPPRLTDKEHELIAEAEERVSGIKIDPTEFSHSKRREVFTQEILRLMERTWRKLPSSRQRELARVLTCRYVGYGSLEPMLDDDELEDIMVIGVDMPVYVFHRKYGMCSTNVTFKTEKALLSLLEKASYDAGRGRIDIRMPILDTRMPDGSRLNLIIPPISLTGPVMSIRKFKERMLNIVDLIDLKTLSIDAAAFLWLLVEGMGIRPANMLIAGGVGCGKSTTLAAISVFVPERERVVSIEDPAELRLPHRHWIKLETRLPAEALDGVTVPQLVKNTLRMRPDRLVIGEARSPEIPDLFAAFSGHVGCMSTTHSNTTAEETLMRLTRPPINVPELLLGAVDVIIMQRLLHIRGQHIRRVTEIAEVAGMEGGRIKLNRTHCWDPSADELKAVGTPSISIRQISELSGIPTAKIQQELKQRAKVLGLLVKKHANMDEIYRMVQEYHVDPDGVLSGLR